MYELQPLTRPQLALSEAEGATLSRWEGISAMSDPKKHDPASSRSFLPPGEGARGADEARETHRFNFDRILARRRGVALVFFAGRLRAALASLVERAEA